MLSTIRDKATGWIAWVVVFLISIPFALWGVNSYFEGQANPPVAKINGEEIGADVYKRALENQRRARRQAANGKVDLSILDSPQFRLRVLNGIVQRNLLVQDAEDQGYRISDDQLNDLIQRTNQFQRDGKFASDLYKLALRSAGYTPSGYEDSLRQDNMLQQIQNGFTQSVISTKKELARLVRLQNQKRAFSYALITAKSIAGKFTPTEKDVKAAYESNTSQYRIPEQVQVSYVSLSVNELAKKIKVTEEQLRQAYIDNAARYVEPEQRRARQIFIKIDTKADNTAAVADAEAKAGKLIKQIEGGADFAKLAKARSEDPLTANKGGDLGYLRSGVLETVFDDALFALKQGEVSKPIRSSFGIHIIKLVGIKKEKKKPLKDVRAELEYEIQRKLAEAQFLEQAEQLNDLSYEQPESLQAVVDGLGLTLKKSAWFSRRGGTGIAAQPQVVEAAFSDEVLADRQNSEAIEIGSDTLVVLRIDGHRESKLKPLAEVKNAIIAHLRSVRARAEISKLGEQLVARLKSGADWNEVLGQNKLSAKQTKPLARDDRSFVKPSILGKVFKMPRPGPKAPTYAGIALGNESYALIRFTKVVEVDPDKVDKDTVASAKAILQTRGGIEYFAGYQKGLRDQADIVIHEDNL
ncbi:MAG: hypothetical protein GXP09_01300 [Gammaproteobacteria bacterium]|nr:hypothetical protein [Gammaproteobacteria bacterium]